MDRKFIHFHNSLGRRYCTVRHQELQRMLSLIWQGTASEESIKEVRAGIQEILTNYPSPAIMNDVQDLYTVAAEILGRLTDTEWNREVNELGVQYIAHVLAPETERPDFVPEREANPAVKFFFSKWDAMEWLRQQMNS